MGKLGIFGGTSLLNSALFSSLKPKIVETDFGRTVIHVDETELRPIVFIQRHHADGDAGADVYRPPHLINHRANIAAMEKEGVDIVVAVCCVGSLSRDIPVGSVVLPDDYFSILCPVACYYDDDRAHIVPGIDMELRGKILEGLKKDEIDGLLMKGAVYVQTVGPRFETKAEVRFLSGLGDVIGMTAAHEATVAKEVGKPYAIVAMVDNMANGLDVSDLTHKQFKANVAKNQATVERAVTVVLEKLLPELCS